LLDKENPDVYAYTRELEGRRILVLNFRDRAASVDEGLDWSKARVMLGNYPAPSRNGQLRPYEAVVYELR
jgi:oligo-1,6-glucosidase